MREKWDKARSIIVESADAPAGATGPTQMLSADSRPYLLEIQLPNGERLRKTLTVFSRLVHAVGEPMLVEVNPATLDVRVDFHAMADLMRSQSGVRPDRTH